MEETEGGEKKVNVWLSPRIGQQIRELAVAEGITITSVIERDLARPIERRHRKLRGQQAAELGGEC